jgi:Copper type II ascorbate-dependent monooxygenase, C-terminal domain
VNILPHMHQLGIGFSMEFMGGAYDGQKFLESKGYDPDNGVLMQYDPAIDLSQGDGLRFSCTWRNTFSKTIVEGTGDNEMCMAYGYAWPYENAYTGLAEGPDQCLLLKLPDLE